MKDHLQYALNYYQELLQRARQSGDVETARLLGLMTIRLAQDSGEIPGVEVDTDEQHNDKVLGYVRSRQLELEHIETLLKDDRPAGVRALADWLDTVARVDTDAYRRAKAS